VVLHIRNPKLGGTIMGFIFNNDAREFFERIGIKRSSGPKKSKSGFFHITLEPYWICAQIGMIKNEFKPPVNEKSAEFVRKFVGESITSHMDLIRGVGFYRYCEREGLLNAEKDEILKEMKNFFSEENKELGNAGYDLFNGYANGGFNLLFQQTGDDCHELSDLLIECYELLSE